MPNQSISLPRIKPGLVLARLVARAGYANRSEKK
jgi:hypothetical protein